MITPEHFQEWQASCVDEDINRLNTRSLSGHPARDQMFISDTIPRRNGGRVREGCRQSLERKTGIRNPTAPLMYIL